MIHPHIYSIHWCGKICPHLEDISSNAALTFELLVVPQIERHGAVCAFSRIRQISDSLCTCMGKPVMPSIDPQCTCAYRGVQGLTANVSRQLRPLWLPSIHSSVWPPGCRCRHFSYPEEAAILVNNRGVRRRGAAEGGDIWVFENIQCSTSILILLSFTVVSPHGVHLACVAFPSTLFYHVGYDESMPSECFVSSITPAFKSLPPEE